MVLAWEGDILGIEKRIGRDCLRRSEDDGLVEWADGRRNCLRSGERGGR